ncbi:MAG: peptide ABC transporter substrate-binding protein [Gemmatimonadota bacterium]
MPYFPDNHMRFSRRVPALCALALSACSHDGTSSGAKHPTTLVFTQPSDADNLVPALSTSEIGAQVDAMLFEKLAEINDSMNVIGDAGARPSLADSWTWSPDSLSIAFHLDPKAHWSDGVPVRAPDVLYSFRVNKSKVVGSSLIPLLADVDSVTARDSVTPVIWFRARSLEQFYNAATQVRVLPAHLMASIADSALQSTPYGRNPVGSGPYKFVRWVSGSTIELVADSTFHRGQPKIDRLIWSITTNGDAAILRLLSGEANFLDKLRKQDVDQVAKHPELKIVGYPSMLVYYVLFNERGRKGVGQHPIFADREVRRALSMAVDRRGAVTTVYDAKTPLLLGPYTSNLASFDPNMIQLPYSPDSAIKLLESRGWVLGKDGVRHKGGTSLEFPMLVPGSSSQRQQMAVMLQDMFKRVGARMTIEHVDFPTQQARKTAHDYDAAFDGMSLDPTPSGIRQEWSSTAAKAEGQSNTGHYMNPAFDATIDSAVSTMDSKAAIALYHRAYAIIANDAPGIWLYEAPALAGMSVNVHPAAMRGDMWWVNLAQWTISDDATKTGSVAVAAGAH